MKLMLRTVSVVLVGTVLFALGATPALCGEEFCAMSGTLVKVEVDKNKALDWGKDRRKVAIIAADSDSWAILALSKSSDDIAILVGPAGVFFGVAGKGGREVSARDAEKAFGRDFRELRETVKKEMGDLWKADVVKISGGDVQPLSDAVGLGILEKKGREWELATQNCAGADLDVSELR
jgi:hypothetical protein